MKRCLFLIITVFIFSGCDKGMYYDYFIVNECDESITVYVEINPREYPKQDPRNIIIQPYESKLIYHGTSIIFLQSRLIEYSFVNITIQKGNKTSKINYIDENMWKFEPDSKNHANSYLTVYPDHFE
jgi:hypothetical protein